MEMIARPETIRIALAAERDHLSQVKARKIKVLEKTFCSNEFYGPMATAREEYLLGCNRRIYKLQELLEGSGV